MRRLLYLVILMMLSASNIHAQVTINSKFKGFTYDELMIPIIMAQKAYDETMGAINELTEYIMTILASDIDTQMRNEMNTEFKAIQSVAKNLEYSGNINDARNGYNRIRNRVRQKVVNYNNRIAQARQRAAQEQSQAMAQSQVPQQPTDWSGTGFALNNGYICTNYHVVEGAKSIEIHGIQGDFSTGLSAEVVAFDKYNDLALLKINDSRFSSFGSIPYSVKTSTADVGEDIFVLGYPLTSTMGDEIKYTTGVISSKTGYQGDVSLYQISAPVQPGNSGGPLFDADGVLIGIVNAKHQDAENVGYAIKATYMKNLVESYTSSSIIPSKNTILSLSRPEQIKAIKKYVFLIKCSSASVSSPQSGLSYSLESSANNQSAVNKSISNGIKTVLYPKNGQKGSCTITKVELSDSGTKIYFHYVNEYDYDGWCSINPNTYILGSNGELKKLLKARNIPISPNKYEFSYKGQTLDFILEFPPLAFATIKYLHLIEPGDSEWKFYDIQL